MLQDLNHLTFTVNDLDRSIFFYQEILGFKLHAKWDKGAYLSLGNLWLCLSLGQTAQRDDYTHYAFSIKATQIDIFRTRLERFGVREWKINTSEGHSIYFLDPDQHKLEAHVGDIFSRLNACREEPYQGMTFYE